MPPIPPRAKALFLPEKPSPPVSPASIPQEEWSLVKRLSVTQGVRGEESPVTVSAHTLRSIAVYQIPTGDWATYHIESGTVICWCATENDAKLIGEVYQTRFALLLRKHSERIALRDSLPPWVKTWGLRCLQAKTFLPLPEESNE